MNTMNTPIAQSSLKAPQRMERAWYTSHEVFDQELRSIFLSTWQYVGHVSEFTEQGSFKTLDVAGQPLLVVRGDDDRFRAFGNTCLHRGALVEARQAGRADRFQCLYHHWQYDLRGMLLRAPLAEAQVPPVERASCGLPEVETSSFAGVLFVNLKGDDWSLAGHLGRAAPILEKILAPNNQGHWEFLSQYDYQIAANWKLFVENTIDGYHANFLHAQSLRDAGSGFVGVGRSVDLHSHGFIEWANDEKELHTGPTQLHLSIFPNILVLYHGAFDVLAIRHVLPLSPAQTVIKVYAFSRAGASSQSREQLLSRFNFWWGPGGRNGADDVKALELTQAGLRFDPGPPVRLDRGYGNDEIGDYNDEHAIRAFWRSWKQCMGAWEHE